jgi:phage gp36-like protein
MYADKTAMLKRYEEKELIQLTDMIEPYTAAIVDAVLNNALEDATSTIDMYIGSKYRLPLGSIPPALEEMACVLAFYRLNRGRTTEELRQDYEDVLKRLTDIAAGKIRLDFQGDEPQSQAEIAAVDAPNRTFNRDTLKGF